MTSSELKELVKSHFSLVEADATNETINEEITENFSEETTEEVVEEVAEVFGEIADENSAFVLKFPGDELEVGDKVVVVTSEGQEMDAPDGEHKLAGGIMIVTKDSIVESISREVAAEEEEDVESEMAAEFAEDEKEEEMESDEKEEEMESEEDKEEMSLESIVEAIVSEVKEEMGKMKEKMAELEDKVMKYEAEPAADPIMKQGPAKKIPMSSNKKKFSQFNLETAANADRIKLALTQIKNKK